MLKTIMNTNKWADLPADILIRILKHGHDLNTDLTRLRGVCHSWRSALPLQQHSFFRSHIQVPSLAHGTWRDRPLFLLETSFYFFSPRPSNHCGEGSSDSSGWVVRMGQIAPNKWRLLNPLSYNDSYNPEVNGNEYLLTDPPIVGEINLLDCGALLLAKALTLVDEVNFNAKPISTKVVGEWDLTSSTRPLSAILVLLAPDPVSGLLLRLLLLRPNDSQKQLNEWAEISQSDLEDKKNNFEGCDIAFCNGIFFVLQFNFQCWRVGIVNPSTLVLVPFATGGRQLFFPGVSLVPSKLNGGLYLFLEKTSTSGFHLIFDEHFGASVDESKQKMTNKLGGEILFCSNYVSFSIPSSTLLQSSTLLNCPPSQHKNPLVRFFMFSKHDLFNTFVPEDIKGLNFVKYRRYKDSIFMSRSRLNLNKNSDWDFGKIKFLFLDVMSEKELDWVYSRLFFPPPAWVKWRCPSLDNVDINLHNLIDESLS